MSVERNDLGLYDRHADAWWDERDRTFASLRRVNRFRLELLEGWLGGDLEDRRVVDLGCGGGLMSVPLARRGARVVGIDLSASSLACARRQAPREAVFLCADLLRTPLADASAELVLLADVLEHVPRPDLALREAARLLAPGGWLYVNTISRTRRARWLAVDVAETLRLVPRGTHDPALFIRPEELEQMAAGCGLLLRHRQGEGIDLLRTLRHWAVVLRPSESLAVGYSALFQKAEEPIREAGR